MVNVSSNQWMVFDLDDTLVDTFTVGWRKCREVARRLGLRPPSRHAFAAHYGRTSFEGCVAAMHPGVDIGRYSDTYDAVADAFPARPLGDAATATVAITRAGFRIGLFTNGPPDKTARKLAAAGLTEHDFEFVRHTSSGRWRKPDARAFRELATEVGIDPATSWYVSDLPADWVGSAAAGFGSIGIVSGAPHVGGTGGLPALVVPRVDAIVGCLPALWSGPGRVRRSPAGDVRAVSFDVGFTLAEHIRSPADLVVDRLREVDPTAERRAVMAALAEYAPVLSIDHQVWAHPAATAAMLTSYYRQVLARLAPPGHPHLASEVIDAYTAPTNWRARPGAADALIRLRRAGIPTGALSNWQPDLPAVLAHTGLLDLLDTVVVSSSIGVAKPAPAAFIAVAQALGVPLDGLVHAGDDPLTDAVGALAAGCRAVLVTSALDAPEVVRVLELMT
jgi:FMN phosphatase YigB (HAD superfamily)